MKVLLLCNKVPYPPKDGGSIATLGLAVSLAEVGCTVMILAMNTQKHYIDINAIPQEIKNKISIELVDVPAYITARGLIKNLLFSDLPYNAQRFISLNYSQKIIEILDREQFDVIQLEGLYLCPYIPLISRHSKAKIAYRSHNIEHEIWKRTTRQASGIRKLYLKILTKRLTKFEIKQINQYDVLVPITDRDGEILNQLGNSKPSITIPAGISIQNKLTELFNFESNVFFIGALDWSPNQEGLLWFLNNCWPTIHSKLPNLILKIAGRNAPEWIVKQIERPSVIYVGEIDDAHLYMNQNGVMIVPLLSGSGMRVKIIEGMALGKAIVTTSIGCEGIPAVNGEMILIADKPSDFADSIIQLIEKEELIYVMGQKAKAFILNEYHNDILAKRLFDFYKNLLP